MVLKKKAVFFTLIAIILAAMVIASFTFYSTYRTKSKGFVVETRVKTMDRFIENLEDDLPRALYIAGFRAVLGIEDKIIATGIYINDSESAIEELVLYGTLDGEQLNLTIDSSINDWFDRINQQAENIGININYNILDFDVNQSDPWTINFYLDVEFNISDTNNVASWNRSKSFESSMKIIGLEDPVYTIEAFGRTTRIINSTDITIDGIDDLKSFLNSTRYRAYSNAPSFLMRLEGDLTSSPYGIETLVNTNELAFYDLYIYDRSNIDYIYFGSQSTTDYKIHNITDIYSQYFRLDQEHITDFNVEAFKYN